jgi:hypothetical protein
MARGQLKLGPADHGRSLTLDEFDVAEFEGVSRYEIIDGSLYCDLTRNEPLGRLHWRDHSAIPLA